MSMSVDRGSGRRPHILRPHDIRRDLLFMRSCKRADHHGIHCSKSVRSLVTAIFADGVFNGDPDRPPTASLYRRLVRRRPDWGGRKSADPCHILFDLQAADRRHNFRMLTSRAGPRCSLVIPDTASAIRNFEPASDARSCGRASQPVGRPDNERLSLSLW
jgi:hypothetical protein